MVAETNRAKHLVKLCEAGMHADALREQLHDSAQDFTDFNHVKDAMDKLTAKLTAAINETEQIATQRKKRADDIRARREKKAEEAKNSSAGDSKTQTQESFKSKALKARMKMQAEQMFAMLESAPKQKPEGEEAPAAASDAAAPAPGGAETEDAVMDGVDAVLSGDMQQAIDNFMDSLKANPEDPVCAYNLACCYSLLKNVDFAVRWFEFSVQWGIASHEELDDPEADPDLAEVASDDRFKAALSTLRSQRAGGG